MFLVKWCAVLIGKTDSGRKCGGRSLSEEVRESVGGVVEVCCEEGAAAVARSVWRWPSLY